MSNQKTYKGRSAYSYVRTVTIIDTMAGTREVFADNGCTLRIDGSTVVMRDPTGIVVTLEASELALKALDSLEAEL